MGAILQASSKAKIEVCVARRNKYLSKRRSTAVSGNFALIARRVSYLSGC